MIWLKKQKQSNDNDKILINLPISFRISLLSLGQSYDCPSANEVTIKVIGKLIT